MVIRIPRLRVVRGSGAMAKWLRSTVLVFLACIVLIVGLWAFERASNSISAHQVSAQTTPGTTQQPAAKPLTVDPRNTVTKFMEAVELGDRDIMLETTGSKVGKSIVGWGSKDLSAFVGHTDFWPLTEEDGLATYDSALPSNASGDVDAAKQDLWLIKTYDNGLKASVHVDSFMRFLDPGGLPSTRCICHFYIDGDFKLEAAGGEWIITKLPNYQEARNDSPWKWGSSPYIYPYPGDALGPYSYPPGHCRTQYSGYSGYEHYR